MINMNMKEKNLERANLIKSKRKEKGWPQGHLAEACGISERTVQRLEQGYGANSETLLAIATALDIDIKTLTKEKFKKSEESDTNIVFLPLIENGKKAIETIEGAMSFEFDYPHLTGVIGQKAASLLEFCKELGDMLDLITINDRVEYAEHIDDLLKELKENNLLVFGVKRNVVINVNDKWSDFTIATMMITEKSSNAILNDEKKSYLALLMPKKQKLSFR